MKLSLRQKQTFYQELNQFLKSGIPLPQAVDALIPETGGSVRRMLKRLLELFRAGKSVPDAFAALHPAISNLEISLVSAASNTGRLEQAFTYLAEYFTALEAIRAGAVRQSIWPIIQLHIGVFVTNVIGLFLGTLTMDEYLLRCAATLGIFYGAGLVLWIGSIALSRLGRVNPAVDRLLGWIPLIGKIRRNLALSRFCATYLMQLEAAINVMDGLRAAAEASQSARIRASVERILPQVRAGSSVGPLLTGQGVFPSALQRAVRLGEETGSLDEDLKRWADYYQKAAVRAMETLGTWLPRIVYAIIAGYLIYAIIGGQRAENAYINQILGE